MLTLEIFGKFFLMILLSRNHQLPNVVCCQLLYLQVDSNLVKTCLRGLEVCIVGADIGMDVDVGVVVDVGMYVEIGVDVEIGMVMDVGVDLEIGVDFPLLFF